MKTTDELKTIKFDLTIDGTKVPSIEGLQKHFTTEIIGYFRSGVLGNFLKSRDEALLAEVKDLEGNDKARTDDALCLAGAVPNLRGGR